jgi:hypothetical protein
MALEVMSNPDLKNKDAGVMTDVNMSLKREGERENGREWENGRMGEPLGMLPLFRSPALPLSRSPTLPFSRSNRVDTDFPTFVASDHSVSSVTVEASSAFSSLAIRINEIQIE